MKIEALFDAVQLDEWDREKHMIAFALRSPSLTAPTVDIIVRPVVSFAEMHANRVEKTLQDVTVHLVFINDLIVLKTGTGRLRDEYDVRILTELRKPADEI